MSSLDGPLVYVRWALAAVCLVRAGWVALAAISAVGDGTHRRDLALAEARFVAWLVLAALFLEGSLG